MQLSDHTHDKFSVLIAGATGATGREVVRELLSMPNLDFMTLLVRKVNHDVIPQSDKVKQVQVDFEKLGLEFEAKEIGTHTFVMSFLGTTKSAAGSSEAYRRVEVDYPRDFARLAKLKECKHAVLMSSDGAKAGSMISYLAQKGQVENEWKKLDFESLLILRPGVLDRGDLKNTMEKIMGWMMTPMLCSTIARAVRNHVRDSVDAGLEKIVLEIVWRNAEINANETKDPTHNFVANSEGVGVTP